MRCLAMFLLLSCGTLVRSAESSDNSAEGIPSELQRLMKEWETNLGHARTLQAAGRLRFENEMFPECKDLDGKSYSDQHACFELWRDGQKYRVDIAYDRTFDVIKKKVHYNLPYGEYRWQAGDVIEKERLQREHGTTQTTMRIMNIGAQIHRYLVESREHFIEKADNDFYVGPEPCRWMWKGSLLSSETFPEYITGLSKLPSTKSIDVESLGGGRYVVRQQFVGSDRSGKVAGSTRIVIDANKGHTVETFAREAGGRTIYDGKFRYALAGKAWVLIGAAFRSYDWMGERPNIVANAVWLNVDEDSLKVNEPIAPEIFTIESLGIHEDAMVRDAVKDKSYPYDD